MAWKNHGGNNFNLNVDNFTAQSGIWNYSGGKLYHKNLGFGTSIGFGTNNPVSRLSFGNHESLRQSIPAASYKEPLIALSEQSDGTKATGLGFYYNNSDNYGVKLFISSSGENNSPPPQFAYEEKSNVKLYITNKGRFLFNKSKNDFIKDLAEVSIDGSIGITGSITLGDNVVDSPNIGTIQFKRGERIGDKGKLLIKVFDANNTTDPIENWHEIVTQDTKTILNIWKTENNQLYYQNNVNIGHNYTTANNTLSVEGNIIVGNTEFIKQQIAASREKQGILLVKRHLNINASTISTTHFDNDTENADNVLMQLNIPHNSPPLNYLLGGNHLDITGSNSLFLCKGKEDSKSELNGNFSFGFGEDLKIYKGNYSFVFGKTNILGNSSNGGIKADGNFVFGDSNTVEGEKNVLFSENSIIKSKNLVVIGDNNKCYRDDRVSKYNLILGSLNKMFEGTDAGVFQEKKTQSAANIFGNSNQLFTKQNISAMNGDAFIVGDSNKINNLEQNQETVVFGNSNTIGASGYIIGDKNKHMDNKAASKSTFIFGNSIDNSGLFEHAGFATYNRVNLNLNKDDQAVEIMKQPKLLFVVGDANDDNSFGKEHGTFSIDVSGAVRCTNIYSNHPDGGLIRCNTIDSKFVKIDGKQVSNMGNYIINHKINLSPDALGGKKLIPLPINGKILSITSTLNMPNLNYNTSGTNIADIKMQLYDDGDNSIQVITHNVNTSVSTTTSNFVTQLGTNTSLWDRLNYGLNRVKYDKTDATIRKNYLYIKVEDTQQGYGNNIELFSSIHIIIQKILN